MPRSDGSQDIATNEPMRIIADALARLRFGAIQLTIHDGKVMQIDVTERRRLSN